MDSRCGNWDGVGPGSGIALYITELLADGTRVPARALLRRRRLGEHWKTGRRTRPRGFPGSIDEVSHIQPNAERCEIQALADSRTRAPSGFLAATAASSSQVNLTGPRLRTMSA